MRELTLSELELIDGGFDFWEVAGGLATAAAGAYFIATTGGLGAKLGGGTAVVGGLLTAGHGLFK